MSEDQSSIEEWRALVAATQQGQPQRRRLLTATDIGLPLAVLIVIGVLASMLISYGDDEVMGAAGESRFFGANRADVASPQHQRIPPVRETAFEHARKHMQPGYRCPQHPEVISEVAGTCPICGEALRWSDGAAAADNGYLDKSATVVDGAKRLKDLSLFGAGWIERLVVGVGAQVQQGELLMEVYVPDFRTGIERQEGVVRLQAPVAGQVHAIHAHEGKFAASGAVVMQIEDSSSRWLKSTVSAAEAARVQAGQRVELLSSADAQGAVPLGEVDEVVMNPDGEGDATVWLRFDDAPVLHAHPEVNVRIHAKAADSSPPEKS